MISYMKLAIGSIIVACGVHVNLPTITFFDQLRDPPYIEVMGGERPTARLNYLGIRGMPYHIVVDTVQPREGFRALVDRNNCLEAQAENLALLTENLSRVFSPNSNPIPEGISTIDFQSVPRAKTLGTNQKVYVAQDLMCLELKR